MGKLYIICEDKESLFPVSLKEHIQHLDLQRFIAVKTFEEMLSNPVNVHPEKDVFLVLLDNNGRSVNYTLHFCATLSLSRIIIIVNLQQIEDQSIQKLADIDILKQNGFGIISTATPVKKLRTYIAKLLAGTRKIILSKDVIEYISMKIDIEVDKREALKEKKNRESKLRLK